MDSQIPFGHPLKAIVEEIVVDEVTKVSAAWNARIDVSEGRQHWLCYLYFTRAREEIAPCVPINPSHFNEVTFRLAVRTAVRRPVDDS